MSTWQSGGEGRGLTASGTCLGHVLAVEGSEARIGLTFPFPAGPDRPTVGKFVAIKGNDTTLVGMISHVSLRPEEEADGFRAMARVDLLGEIERTGAGGSRFRRGVREYAAIGDPVEMIGRAELNLIYASSSARAITVGHLSQDPSIPAYVDTDHLLAKHFAVVGSTGVGKSSAVASIVGKMIDVRPELRVLLLDVHNEYRAAFGSRANVIGAENLRLPFWLFNFEETTNVIYGGKPAAPEEVEILAELIPMAKANYQNGAERVSLERRQARRGGFTADTPSPYHLQDLLGLIRERMGKLENRSSSMTHHRLMIRIEAIKNDPRYEFMFKNANLGGDTMAAVLNQVFSLESETLPLTILKLASLPDEVVDAVVCVLARLAFDFALWSDGAIPILLVCEEAHRYAWSDQQSGFAPARRALKRIAREGRKYGVHLGLVTQRPAELDPTIISQCSTFFVMRMTNDADQALLRSAVSEAAANLLAFVPSLGAQEAIGIGEGMPLVARITFSTLAQAEIPRSDSGAREEGGQSLERSEVVRSAIERWRRATTSHTFRVDEDIPAAAEPAVPQSALRLAVPKPASDGQPLAPGRWGAS